MGVIRWEGNTSPAWGTAANWIGGVLPTHGDDVEFLTAYLGSNRCTSGPATVVLLNSITADYGGNTAVCYAKCGMSGSPVDTVTITGANTMTGGFVGTLNLNHTSAQMNGGTAATVNLNGADGNCRIITGTVTTANLNVDDCQIQGAATVATANVYGDDCQITASANVTTANFFGDGGYAVTATFGTINFYGDGCKIHSGLVAATTVNVYGDTALISLTAIAGGAITNGPFLHGWNQIISDNDTAKPIADTTQLPISKGEW